MIPGILQSFGSFFISGFPWLFRMIVYSLWDILELLVMIYSLINILFFCMSSL